MQPLETRHTGNPGRNPKGGVLCNHRNQPKSGPRERDSMRLLAHNHTRATQVVTPGAGPYATSGKSPRASDYRWHKCEPLQCEHAWGSFFMARMYFSLGKPPRFEERHPFARQIGKPHVG